MAARLRVAVGHVRRGVLVALVVLPAVALLAGCSNVLDGPSGPNAPTTTPAPVPTADPASVALAPGVTGSGVVNPDALARSHERYLANRSYTLTVNRTTRYANGTLRSQVVTRIRLAANRTYSTDIRVAGPHATVVIGEPPANATFWSDGRRYLRRFGRGDETVYNEFRPVSGAGTWTYWVHFFVLDGRASTDIEATFDAVETSVIDRSVENDSGAVRLASVGGHRSEAFVDIDDARNVRDVRVAATVATRGYVRAYDIRYVATIHGEAVRVSRTVEYEAVGETSVGRPSWYDRAVASD